MSSSHTDDRAGGPSDAPVSCPQCRATTPSAVLDANLNVCPACGCHHRIGATRRIACLVDPGSFTATHTSIGAADPLAFAADGETYPARLARAAADSGLDEALVTGLGRIEDIPAVLAVVDWRFIMGSMGSAMGERFCRAAEDAVRERMPLVCIAASGGARMHEGTVGLMQMAKTVNSVRAMNAAGVPFISVLTDPTSGGMWASFASLGDVVIAEPGAYIGFAGQRLIEGALGVKPPPGFQTSEYQFENGFIDAIVERAALRGYLGRVLRCFAPAAAALDPGARNRA